MKPVITSAVLALTLWLQTPFVWAQEAETPDGPAMLTEWQADPAQIFDVTDENLADFLWLARPLVVFAESPNDPQFRLQLDLLQERLSVLALRDVIVMVDTTPNPPSPIRTALRPRGFMLVGIDKDGRVLFRKPLPWDVREISRSIDKSPIRLQEIEDGHLKP